MALPLFSSASMVREWYCTVFVGFELRAVDFRLVIQGTQRIVFLHSCELIYIILSYIPPASSGITDQFSTFTCTTARTTYIHVAGILPSCTISLMCHALHNPWHTSQPLSDTPLIHNDPLNRRSPPLRRVPAPPAPRLSAAQPWVSWRRWWRTWHRAECPGRGSGRDAPRA